MSANERTVIQVKAQIIKPIQLVWKLWTSPEDIVAWNNASEDWHTPHAENDLRIGGTFKSRMEAKDGSMGFDFEGIYTNVVLHQLIEYKLADDRRISVRFAERNGITEVVEDFDAETENPAEMQRAGWQAILDNFKRYAEEQS